MNTVKLFRRVFAIVLMVAWGGYAVLNAAARLPYLQRGYQSGWDLPSRWAGAVEAAGGGVLFQEAFQDLTARGEHALGKRTSNDFLLVRAENGQYMYSTFYTFESYDYANQALQLREVQRAQQARDAAFLYVNCIPLYIEGAGDYGSFPVTNLNPRSDAFLYELGGYGVEYLDTRAVLAASGLPPAEHRYDTEPHWTVQAAFEAYLALMEQLKAQGVGIDPEGFYTDAASFERIEYPNAYVGELGKRMGLPHVEPEDFTLMVPGFGTDFTLEYLEGDPHPAERGDFASVLLDSTWLENENPYERNFYNTYLTAEHDYRVLRNEKNPDGPKLLVIGDSYMLPVAAFLATAAGEVHLMWPYGLPGGQPLTEYLAENPFDGVVVGMNPSSLEGSSFNYLAGIEVPPLQ